MTTLKEKSGNDLNQMAIRGEIKLEKQEKTDNGFYCGTWYMFSTLSGEPIKTVYVPAGFGI